MKTKQLLSKTFVAAFTLAAIFTSSSLFGQVKIGTNPTVIDANNNLEVEASTAGRKVSIEKTTGKVTIADGSQGTNKVLTSDANGIATWQLPAAQSAETWIKATGGSVQAVGFVASPTTLDFSAESADRSNEFDLTSNTITILTSGIYLVTAGAKKNAGGVAGQWGAALVVIGSIGGSNTLANVDGTNSAVDAPLFSGSATVFFQAGEVVNLEIFRGNAAPAFNIQNKSLSIVKLSN